MITQEIKKYKEPEPYVYVPAANPSWKTTFSEKEIADAVQTAELCGLTRGLILLHTLTGHKITILGIKTEGVTSYQDKPTIITARREREGYDWVTCFTVDELLHSDFKVVGQTEEYQDVSKT